MAKKNIKSRIYDDLKEQLDINGTYNAFTEDLLQDYLSMFQTKNKLIADINKVGIKVTGYDRTGNETTKPNGSVADLIKTNAQMLKLLDALGIKSSKIAKLEDDEDDV